MNKGYENENIFSVFGNLRALVATFIMAEIIDPSQYFSP